MTLSLAFSPCPNDCFMFDAIVNRRIDLEGLEFSIRLAVATSFSSSQRSCVSRRLAISALAGALTTLALALAPSPFAFYDAYDWLMGSLLDRSLGTARRRARRVPRDARDRRVRSHRVHRHPHVHRRLRCRARAVRGPDRSAASSAAGSQPTDAAAVWTVARSPAPSAAATSRSFCEGAGSRRTRARKARSTPSVTGNEAGRGSCPNNSPAVNAVGSSTSASGFPPASSSIRPRSCCSC